MPELKNLLSKRIARRIAQEIAQEVEQEKVKTFHLEQFLKNHKRTKKGPYTWKSSPKYDDKQWE
ncbi:hypothetical protein DYO40_21915 [Salmonella enterica subsp. enterica serovar Javiana]|nr:hypothetical protein [Salmonella enterica subsp. enterica serovar Javiana]ECV1375382.1 hypothetical protein [Salmonella enterica subsp. enterica serovar Javiana]EEI9041267.1 hypothetical protein [Salmonella enterica subsp. enterica serovar Javiana]